MAIHLLSFGILGGAGHMAGKGNGKSSFWSFFYGNMLQIANDCGYRDRNCLQIANHKTINCSRQDFKSIFCLRYEFLSLIWLRFRGAIQDAVQCACIVLMHATRTQKTVQPLYTCTLASRFSVTRVPVTWNKLIWIKCRRWTFFFFKVNPFHIQTGQINMAVFFWYLVKSDLSCVGCCTVYTRTLDKSLYTRYQKHRSMYIV